MPGGFVVGVGGAGSGFEAARVAARNATALGVPLVLVFGFEASSLAPSAGPLEDRVALIGNEALAQIQAEIEDSYPSLSVEVEFVAQRPADALIAVAESHSAEAIAVGHGGKGPLRGALLGNVTYEIVHRSTIPVLVVPNDEEDTVPAT
jgi:nucleotide-binding universal stress UspA family protein